MSPLNPQKTSFHAATALVDGVAVGRAITWAREPAPRERRGSVMEERLRLERAIRTAIRGVEELSRLLPRAEAELFEPELAILRELEPQMLAAVDRGSSADFAVTEAMSKLPLDLLVDAQARLLDGLAQDSRTVESLLEGRGGDRVLATETLAPSVVASLPNRVVGVVTAPGTGKGRSVSYTSHAVILARARLIPVVVVPHEVIAAIEDDVLLVVDSTQRPASISISPNDEVLASARERREEWTRRQENEQAEVAAPLGQLGLQIHVNVGSLGERVPASADGVGLVRTELVFASWTHAPSEMQQLWAFHAIGAQADGMPIVVRLFDAGGDKPLPWLPAPDNATEARGVELLFMHPLVLATQLRAIRRASDRADVRILLPFVHSPEDVKRVRAETGGSLPIGAMIETLRAVELCDEIAQVSDFVCIGTNDLFAIVTGKTETGSTLPYDTRVLAMIERVVAAAQRYARKVAVCGEMAAEPLNARVLVGLGVDAISVATERFAKVKLSFRDVTRDDCLRVAAAALAA